MVNNDNQHMVETPELSRRKFLQFGAAVTAGATALLSSPAHALDVLTKADARELSLYNIHTREKIIKATYWENGQYLADGLAEINHLLRDYRTGETAQIDKRLIDLLFLIQQKVDSSKTFEIISGYRSPRTNAKIRNFYGKGVANRSMHMDGLAVDVRLPGTRLEHLKKAALSLHSGGVGYYPRDQFVHVDVGRVRHWEGKNA